MRGCDFWDASKQTFDHSRGLQDLSIDSFALSQPFINYRLVYRFRVILPNS